MPQVVLFRSPDGVVPFLVWFDRQERAVQDRCLARLARLKHVGHALRRPESAPLRDGIHELRLAHRRVQFRVLYFFHGRERAVITHAIRKHGAAVSDSEVDRALRIRRVYASDPARHIAIEDLR